MKHPGSFDIFVCTIRRCVPINCVVHQTGQDETEKDHIHRVSNFHSAGVVSDFANPPKGVAMDTEPYLVVAGLLIRKAVTW